MNSYKYACPHCGQNIEYSDDYSGRKMPCPACQQAITIPGVAPAMARSSLRLERDIPQPARKFRFSFLALLGWFRSVINRKSFAAGLLAVLFLGGA
jgi:DNA-directed RNA polymerase subunit RPC12/RpoP